MLEQSLLHVLLYIWRNYWLLIIIVALLSSGLTMVVGSARWWWVRVWRRKELWTQERDEYEAELQQKDDYIASLEHALHEARHAEYVGAVVNLIERRK